MKDQILQTLADDGPLHVMEITDRVDGHPITIDRICAQLHKDGHIYPSGHGQYQLTNDERQQLRDNKRVD